MKFQKTIPADMLETGKFQRGQWVMQCGAKGQYMGTRRSGVHVVIWHENYKNREDKKEYRKTLIDFAKSC